MMSTKPVREQAIEWLLLLTDAPVSAATREAFSHWLREDPTHLAEYRKAKDAFLSSRSAHLPVRVMGFVDQISRPIRTAMSATTGWAFQSFGRAAVCSGMIALVLAGGWWTIGEIRTERFQTEAGEMSRKTLADGSIVEMNGDSRIAVRMRRNARDISVEQGEAMFTVAKDPNRPFRVRAGNVVVQAVGTAFNVARNGESAEIAVAHGVVIVEAGSSQWWPEGKAETATLHEGDAILVQPATPLPPARRVSADMIGRWRERLLTAEDMPLGMVIASLSRFYPGKYRLEDKRLENNVVTITNYLVRDRDRTIRYFELSHDLVARPDPDGTIVFRPAPRTR